MRNRETGLLSAHVLQCWGAICSALAVFLALFVLAAEAQPPLRKYPFAQVGLVLPNYWEAPTDPATVNYFMSRHGSATANTVKRWETEHADLFAGGDYGLEFHQNNTVLTYAHFHAFFFYDNDAPIRNAALRRDTEYGGINRNTRFPKVGTGLQRSGWWKTAFSSRGIISLLSWLSSTRGK